MRPLFATPQGSGAPQAGAAAAALRQTMSGVNLPEGLALEDLLRLGEEIVPAPKGEVAGHAAGFGSKLEGLNPMQLAAFLAAKVRHQPVCPSSCSRDTATHIL